MSTHNKKPSTVNGRINYQNRFKEVGWYYWLLTEHSLLIIILCIVMVVTFGTIAFVFTNPPDFSDPSKGFEVRGTILANKLRTWHKLMNETGYMLTLSNYPYKYFQRKHEVTQKLDQKVPKRSIRSTNKNEDIVSKSVNYFCDNPKTDYASWTLTLERTDKIRVWSLEGLLRLCQIEKDIANHSAFHDVCIRKEADSCCLSMSLPNYVAFLGGEKTCSNISARTLNEVSSLLSYCSEFYCKGQLVANCWNFNRFSEKLCSRVPEKCTKFNAVYSVFYYLLDKSAVCPFSLNNSLKFVSAFIPVFKYSNNLLPLYYTNFATQSFTPFILYSVDLGIREEAFRDQLSLDSIYPAFAMTAVSLILLLYTKSAFITFMSFASTMSAMIISYFFYKVLFNFQFFPFLNLASVLVMVGLSADGVLVFYSTWKHSIYAVTDSRVNDPLPQLRVIMKMTMNRVSWSFFVTYSTTAAAFFSSYASQVTAIKCFSVYTGLTVLSNLLLSLSWLPAVTAIHHKHMQGCFTKWTNKLPKTCFFSHFLKFFLHFYKYSCNCLRIFFEQIQVLFIVHLRYIWSILYFAVALGAIYVVFVSPTFKLPSGQTNFHYFKLSHPFEKNQVQKFAFQNHSHAYLPFRFVFGVWPSDDGDQQDPSSTGSLHFQGNFNVSTKESQIWLFNFCQSMKKFSNFFSPSHRSSMRQDYANCFIEGFRSWMSSRDCSKHSHCCSSHRFPYQPMIFEHCLKEAIFELDLLPGVKLQPSTPGPRYNSMDVISAIIIEFSSNISTSASIEQVQHLYDDVSAYFDPLLRTAPPGLVNGWFVSDIEFFALQKGLYEGSLSSMGWSLLVSLIVILMTSRNLIISLFACITIGCIICVTVACLVLLGWELNILESITVSIAVGLSVDFTAHYAIAYLLTSSDDRIRRVEAIVTDMCPAITLAALTTFVAGASMMPATVLVFYKFGVFLMITTLCSWLYSTYFFIPLLSIAGPLNGCCGVRHCQRNMSNNERITETTTCSPSTSSHYDVIERTTVL